MLNTILHYLTLIFAVACFAIIYFKLLSRTVFRVTSPDNKNGNISTIYTSFLLRIILAFMFFYCLLKYYNDIRDIILVFFVFIATRYFIVRHEKRLIENEPKNNNPDFSIHHSKNAKTTGFSKKTVKKTASKSNGKGKYGKR